MKSYLSKFVKVTAKILSVPFFLTVYILVTVLVLPCFTMHQ